MSALSARAILDDAIAYFGISEIEMTAHRRAFSRERQIVMWLCRKYTDKTLWTIGKTIGNRDHTSVHYGCAMIEKLRLVDPVIAGQVKALEKRVKALAEKAEAMSILHEESPHQALEHLGAALAIAEELSARLYSQERTQKARQGVRQYRTVPAHIIDRDLVAHGSD